MENIKPNFFIVGAPKCGTTAWVEYLGSHPDICFSVRKEPHYFNTDFPRFRWADSIEAYLSYFKNCAGAKVVGEASVQYLYSEEAARNIAEFSPKAKILIFLRSPGSFISSYHNQLLLNADEDEIDLRKAWETSGCRIGRNLPNRCRERRLLDYKRVGLFSVQLERYTKHFAAENIKVVFFEKWIHSPRKTYLEILDFLGLDDDGRFEFTQVHSARQVLSFRLNGITQRPPEVLRLILFALRKIPGMRNFSPVKSIRNFNARAGYKYKKNKKLEDEIDQFFSDDQRRLHEILDKLSSA